LAERYRRLSFKAVKELAAPQTWVAAICPVFIGGAICASQPIRTEIEMAIATSAVAIPYAQLDDPSPAIPYAGIVAGAALNQLEALFTTAGGIRALSIWALMLVCAVALQSAVNTYNDYRDFISGLDTAQTVLDETDASIVYNHINPRSALKVVAACLVIAGLTGIAIVALSSWILLVLGLVAVAAVFFYSGGPVPLSRLPLGELVSGLVMGGVITAATCLAITGDLTGYALAACLPAVVGIALIMQTNNTCDIERDTETGRHTLPVIIGRRPSVICMTVLALAVFAWMTAQLIAFQDFVALVAPVIALLFLLPTIRRMLKGPYDLANRRAMMGNINRYNKVMMMAWSCALLLCAI
jgi:1,4-dihydroxy-2-naphthoate octaprenyltransferase